ncbi:MAG: hypothetical protein ACR2HF_11535 [Methylococcaceae bacterium]
MQNDTAKTKTIGRRPVYPVCKTPSADGSSVTGHESTDFFSEKTAQTIPYQARHTITVLGRISSYLSDK